MRYLWILLKRINVSLTNTYGTLQVSTAVNVATTSSLGQYLREMITDPSIYSPFLVLLLPETVRYSRKFNLIRWFRLKVTSAIFSYLTNKRVLKTCENIFFSLKKLFSFPIYIKFCISLFSFFFSY